eukprot:scaffold3827_cov179-Cylindrotheca_fusiformis.AAC.14
MATTIVQLLLRDVQVRRKASSIRNVGHSFYSVVFVVMTLWRNLIQTPYWNPCPCLFEVIRFPAVVRSYPKEC